MNYIAEIKALYDWIPFNPMPADAQALWHALMYLNNKCAIEVEPGKWLWRAEFSVSNTVLLSILGFSRTQLDRMRNVLIQSGRIRYRKGKGNQCGTYQMIPFDDHYVTQPVTHSVTQTGTQTVTQMWHKQGPLNNNTSTCNSNFNSPFGGGDGLRVGAESALGAYLEERGLDNRYLGMSDEVYARAEKLTGEIFAQFVGREPTKQDVSTVLNCVRESVERPDSSWAIEFPKDRVELLMYAFESASAAGSPGNWPFVNGVLARLAQRGIKTLAGAEEYEDSRH